MTEEQKAAPENQAAEATTPVDVAPESTPAAETATATVEKPAAPKVARTRSIAAPERKPRGGGRGRNARGPREPKEFEESILQIDRVTRVTKGGRQMRFRVSVVIGDKKGRVGFGIGKSNEVLGSIQKGIAKAKKNLINVPIFDGTIPHEIKAKFKASQVHLLPAPKGKGVIAGGATRKILELSGVKDVLSKIHGSRNKINCVLATFKALEALSKEAPRGKKVAEAPAKEEAPKAEVKKETKKPAAKKAPAKKAAPKKTDK